VREAGTEIEAVSIAAEVFGARGAARDGCSDPVR